MEGWIGAEVEGGSVDRWRRKGGLVEEMEGCKCGWAEAEDEEGWKDGWAEEVERCRHGLWRRRRDGRMDERRRWEGGGMGGWSGVVGGEVELRAAAPLARNATNLSTLSSRHV